MTPKSHQRPLAPTVFPLSETGNYVHAVAGSKCADTVPTPFSLSHLNPISGQIILALPRKQSQNPAEDSSVVAYLSNDWEPWANYRSNRHGKKRFKTSYCLFYQSLLPRSLLCAMADLTFHSTPPLINLRIPSTGECHVLLKTTTVSPQNGIHVHVSAQHYKTLTNCCPMRTLLLRTSFASFQPYSRLSLKKRLDTHGFYTSDCPPDARSPHTHSLFCPITQVPVPISLPWKSPWVSLHRTPSPITFYLVS